MFLILSGLNPTPTSLKQILPDLPVRGSAFYNNITTSSLMLASLWESKQLEVTSLTIDPILLEYKVSEKPLNNIPILLLSIPKSIDSDI